MEVRRPSRATHQPDYIRLVPNGADPFDATTELIERLGWVESADYSAELVEWVVPGDGRTVVRWIEDETGSDFFVVDGPDCQRVARQIEESIPMLRVADFERYLAQWDHHTAGLMTALYTVAAAAPRRCDRAVVELLERYMNADDPLVRRAALLATAITGWPEFVGTVSRFRDDPDPDVRACAETVLAGLLGADRPQA